MKRVSKKQIEALLLTTPGPLGACLSQKEAGMVLGITKGAIAQRLGRFKSRFPAGWGNIMSIRDVASRQRENLEHPLKLIKDVTDIQIVEKF